MTDWPFIKGLQLSELFFQEAVAPILEKHFPTLKYSAARLDWGSDVLGFDTPRSMDHGWGPRLQVFLAEADLEQYRGNIVQVLGQELPYEIHGIPTHFSNEILGEGWLQKISSGPITHGVSLHSIQSFFHSYLGCDPGTGLGVVAWLTMPEQKLRTVAAGRVFYDGLGELGLARERLRYYPRDVWLYLLAAQWRRIDQEEPFMGRTGDVGDELGPRIIAARLVKELMRLCFLMEQQFVPYSKWFGTAFAQLRCGPELLPILTQVLNGQSWQAREPALAAAYEYVAVKHNALGVTPPQPTQVSHFYDRPYLVIHSGRFVEAIRAAIVDEAVKRLPAYLGSIDQCIDSIDVLEDVNKLARLPGLYAQ